MRRLRSADSVQTAAPASTGTTQSAPSTLPRWAAAVISAVALVWAYWPTIINLQKEWSGNPNYSVCQLVPFAALYLLWEHRRALKTCKITPSWWGLVLVLLAQVGWFFGLLFVYESAERYALVLTIVGLTLLITGRQVCRRIRWILLFLFLMVPLPGRIHNMVSGPLQEYATISTVFVLETFGADISRNGNTLSLGGAASVGIAEACSGLRMLTAFVVVAAVFALLVNRPRWQKITLLISSVPVAIICNVVRLVATVVLYAIVDSSMSETFFHDFAGVTMMPVAIAILVGELWLMNRLIIPEGRASASAK